MLVAYMKNHTIEGSRALCNQCLSMSAALAFFSFEGRALTQVRPSFSQLKVPTSGPWLSTFLWRTLPSPLGSAVSSLHLRLSSKVASSRKPFLTATVDVLPLPQLLLCHLILFLSIGLTGGL